MTDTARIILWGTDIGAVTWLQDRNLGVFQYTPEFAEAPIEVAPLAMPLRSAPYQFPGLPQDAFKGLPGLIADSLPDRFGNALINAWLSQEGRSPDSFSPVERLCYTGSRGMGALEFKPRLKESPSRASKIELESLVDLINRVLNDRIALSGKFTGDNDQQAIEDILRVGTSAGGARAKAVLAWNETTGEFKSGQASAEKGFSQWLLKFDGIHGNKDKELADPQGFGRIEYAYHLMARAAGIHMEDCRLFEEGGRAHFMTKRFDRTPAGDKLHMQSLGALCHYDFNAAGAYSYEQAIDAIRSLDLPIDDREQQVRRAFFNIVARNQDDHVKNIAFLMDRRGTWRLSPAYDVAYAFNPSGAWTNQHQMSLNGKRDGFDMDDLIALGAHAGFKTAKSKALLADVMDAVIQWPSHAEDAEVLKADIARIGRAHRTGF